MKASSGSNPGNCGHVLLVDDHNAGLRARKSILEELGYRVTAACGVEEALKTLAKETPDIVVTDYRMPKVDGLQFIEKIRTMKPEVPIILLSGYVDVLGLSEENTGADLVIAKSSREVEHLIRGVARLLRRKLPRKPPGAVRGSLKAKAKSV